MPTAVAVFTFPREGEVGARSAPGGGASYFLQGPITSLPNPPPEGGRGHQYGASARA